MADKITPIASVMRKTPKQIARSFFDGTLTAEDRKTMSEGLRHWIDLATTDNPRATTAKRAALKDLADLADLAQDDGGAGARHTVQIVRIQSIDNGVAQLAEG